MPNDAKLGLVVGVGVVIALAVMYYRNDLAGSPASGRPEEAGTITAVNPAPTAGPYRPLSGRSASRNVSDSPFPPAQSP